MTCKSYDIPKTLIWDGPGFVRPIIRFNFRLGALNLGGASEGWLYVLRREKCSAPREGVRRAIGQT